MAVDYEHETIKHLTKEVKAYLEQRGAAKRRGIDFLLTFFEWHDWWQQTGYFDQRGAGKGKYVMARFDDEGPYALDNIKCITHSDNLTEMVRSDKFKKRLKDAHNGIKTIKSTSSLQVHTGLPEKQPKPKKLKFSELPEDEQARIRKERSLKGAATKRERGTARGGVPNPHSPKHTIGYTGKKAWNSGKKLPPRTDEVKQKIRDGVNRFYKQEGRKE